MGKAGTCLVVFLTAVGCEASTLSSLPYRFEQNRGQAPAGNPFVARSSNYEVLASPAGPILVYQGPGKKRQSLETVIRGGDRHARITAENPQSTHTNYLIGSDPGKWLHDVPSFGRVRYAEVYPSIDLIFHGDESDFEFDFEVKPGGDPRAISLAWKGANKIRLSESGDLLVTTGAGDVHWAKPVIYQTRGGNRAQIAGGFRLKNNTVSFDVANYDRNETLTIDPTVSFVSFFGGSGNDAAAGVAVDSSGNILIAGYTTSSNLPTSSNSAQPGFGGLSQDSITGDAFVAQTNPSGTALNWVTYLGGSQDDLAYGIAVDGSGNAYVTGMTNSSNFPVKNAAFAQYGGAKSNQLNPLGDAFVAKLNSSGQLVYSTYFGGSDDESGMAIAVDSSGNAYITGTTLSLNLPVTGNSAQKQFNGSGGNSEFCGGCGPVLKGGDAFATKFDSTGKFQWTTYLGGSGDDTGMAVAVDKSGNVYVGGTTLSNNFPTTTGAAQTKFGGAASSANQPNIKLGDGFVTKINPTGTAFLYSTYLGGSSDDAVFGIAVDANGNAYVTGATSSSDFPTTTGVVQTKFAGPATAPQPPQFRPTFVFGDSFAAKLQSDGSGLVYSTYLGGLGDDGGVGIAVDANGNAFIVGHTMSTDFPVTTGTLQSSFAGSGNEGFAVGDLFLAELNSTGTAETYGTYLGGSANDAGAGIALDGSGNAVVSGYTVSNNLPVTSGVFQTKYGGNSTFGDPKGDALIAKFSGLNPATPSILPGGVVPVYSPSTTIQPGSWFSIFGDKLASQSATWNGDYPKTLGGTTVTVNGKNAFLWFVANGQINAQAPDDTTTGSVPVVVTNSLGSATGTVTLGPASPSLLVFADGKHVTGIIQTPNGSGSQGGGTYDFFGPTSLGAGYRPAKAGESVAIYAVGLGPVNQTIPAGQAYNCPPTGCATMVTTPSLTIGGSSVPLVFSGVVSEGLYQINFTAPANLSGDQTVNLKLGSGQQTQSGILAAFQ